MASLLGTLVGSVGVERLPGRASFQMGLVETEAIVLQTFKLADADKIVVCMTANSGLVRGVARGARRMKSKFGASLEPFTLIRLTFFEKETRELVNICNSEILESHFGASGDGNVVQSLAHIAGLVKEFAPPNQADLRLFKMLRACLKAAASNPNLCAGIPVYAELWTLRITGLLPDQGLCGGCRKKLLETDGSLLYLSTEGILRCQDCGQMGGQRIGRQTHTLLTSIRYLSPEAWAQNYCASSDESKNSVSKIAADLVRRALEKEIYSGKVLPATAN